MLPMLPMLPMPPMLPMLPMLRMARPGMRRRPRAYWLLDSERLVVAVIAPTDDEPLLTACGATATREPVGPFAPGLLELATATRCGRLEHCAALSARYARVERAGPEAASAAAGELHVAIDSERIAVASQAAVSAASDLFARAGLRLAALDAADCALVSLREALGELDAPAQTLQPLAAISIAAEAEDSAYALASLLAVPVGLALARMGGGHAHC